MLNVISLSAAPSLVTHQGPPSNLHPMLACQICSCMAWAYISYDVCFIARVAQSQQGGIYKLSKLAQRDCLGATGGIAWPRTCKALQALSSGNSWMFPRYGLMGVIHAGTRREHYARGWKWPTDRSMTMKSLEVNTPKTSHVRAIGGLLEQL